MCSTIFSLSCTTKACPDGDQLSAELNSDSDAHSIVWYSLKGNVCFASTILAAMMAGLSSCCVVLVWYQNQEAMLQNGKNELNDTQVLRHLVSTSGIRWCHKSQETA